VKSNIPEVRFPGFSGDWEECKLGEMVDFFNEKRIPIDSEKRIKGQYPYFGATGIIDYVEGYIFKGEYVLLAEDGANITTRNRPIAYLAQGEFWVNNHAHIMKMKSGSNFFLVQLLEKQNYDKYNTGTAQPKLNGQVVKNIILNFPSEKEQIKVGKIFESLERSIALHQQELTTFKQTKQGFLQKMFPSEGESVPEVRFPGFTGGWEQRMLKDLADFSKGNGYSKGDLTEEGNPIILYGRLYTNYEAVIESVDTYTLEKEKSVLSKGNEVIVPSSGETSEDIARASAVIKPGLILGGDLNIIQPRNEIDSVFLALAISNGKQQKELIKRAQGKSVVHLHNSDLKKVNLLFPNKLEQIKIGDFFKQLDYVIALHQRELDSLKETKKAFLQKMFV
jgi:type I restriction enzyme, S subunit